jgi:dihydropteroate synthase
MIEEGADIVDIGGASSRPNADEITSDEEISRISTAVKISSESNLFMSIDTNNYLTAKYAITHGAKIINDINGLEDDNMARLVADSKVAVVIMHKRGNSKEMIDMTNYQNLIHDIKVYFSERIEKALKFGVDMKSIILDVG